jgi:hypothetical protein
MSNSLSAVITANKKTSTHKSTKNPAFYNKELRKHERAMSNDDNAIVREAAVSNIHCSSGTLVARLEVEQEAVVIRAILMHPNLPLKYIEAFAGDERAEMFNTDQELADALIARIAG